VKQTQISAVHFWGDLYIFPRYQLPTTNRGKAVPLQAWSGP